MTAARPCDIAIFIRALEGGGAQRDAVLLANALAERGATVSILTLHSTGRLAPHVATGVAIIQVGARSLRSCPPALRAAILKLSPGVVLSSEAAQNVVTALMFATIPHDRRPRLVLREVTSPSWARRFDPYLQNRLAYQVFGLACRQADCVLTLTEGARTDLIDNFALPPGQVSVMRSNAVIDAATMARLSAFDGETGREPGLIVAVGRLSPEKDHLTLIEAMAHLPPAARLVIAGDGPMRAPLQARIDNLQLGGRVALAGYTSDPFMWPMRASLSVSSSRFEGLGNTIIEALACGTPVVATDCPYGPREILHGGRYGQLVPVGDPIALAAAMREALGSVKIDRPALKARAAAYTADAAAVAFETILYERGLIGAQFARMPAAPLHARKSAS